MADPASRILVEFHAHEPDRLAAWWAHALGWTADGVVVHPVGSGVPLRFLPSTRSKTGKNGVHLDLASNSHQHQQKTVERLFNAGARFADIGQGSDIPWVVMTDPEGNELCVLEPRQSYKDRGALASIVVDCDDPHTHALTWASATGMTITRDEKDFATLRASAGPDMDFLREETGPESMVRVTLLDDSVQPPHPGFSGNSAR